jgi:hypothetical protein
VALAKAYISAPVVYMIPPSMLDEASAKTDAELSRILIASPDTVAAALTEAELVRILSADPVADALADILPCPSRMRSAVTVAEAFAEALTVTSKIQVSADSQIALSRENASVSKLPPNRSSCSSVYGPQTSAMIKPM